MLPTDVDESTHQIGTLNEKSLHAALKRAYAQDGDRFEVPVDGYHVDLVRGDLLVEFQTGNFSALKRKLAHLVLDHPVRLVHPIPAGKWLVKLSPRGKVLSRRKSPKRGCVDDIFEELVSLPALLAEPNFSLEVLMTYEEEVLQKSRDKWRRGGWATVERRLLGITDRWVFETPADLADLLPAELPCPFTTTDIASRAGKPLWIAQKMAYCLRQSGALTVAGKKGQSILYHHTPAA